jgi:UDP-MurNAc hydroxylase
MKITNIGGATAIIEHNNKRILFDPWLDDGIFHGSWYHFPPAKIKLEELGRFDYVFISHIHEDHCSKGTIKHINKDAEIILMDRTPNLVARFLMLNHFDFKKIHLIKPHTPTKIAPDLTIDMLTADPQHDYNYYVDSAIIMKWNDFTLYNANDCAPYPESIEYLKQNYKIDLALIPYAGGSGYPSCFRNLDDNMKNQESLRIQKQCLDRFVDTYEKLKPKYIMPFADQYVIAGSRSHLNKFLSHPAGPGSVYDPMEKKGYASSLLLLNSGQSFDFSTKTKMPDEPHYFFTSQEREEYIEKNLKDKSYQFELFDLSHGIPIERLFKYARQRMWDEQKKQDYFPKFKYYFEVNDRNRLFKMDLQKDAVEEIAMDAHKDGPYILVACSFNLFAYMLLGHISWDTADAALFLDYERVPNVYDTKAAAFLNFIRI